MPASHPVVDAALPARGELRRDQRGRQQEDDRRDQVEEDAGQAVDGHRRRRPQAGHRDWWSSSPARPRRCITALRRPPASRQPATEAPSAGTSAALMTPSPIGSRMRPICAARLAISPATDCHARHGRPASPLCTSPTWTTTIGCYLEAPIHGVNFTIAARTSAKSCDYSTTRRSWSVLLSRRPPSSVTVTMSSIRTPNSPAR